MKQNFVATTFAIVLASFFTGCAGETTGPSESGTVGVNLVVGSTDVTAVTFDIACESGLTLSGEFNVNDERDPPVWAAIMDLPQDLAPIRVLLSDGDAACEKTKSFQVECGGASLVCEYVQDFEALDPADPGALANDGWLYFGSVFDGTGDFKFQFGPFAAPTTAGQVSLIASGGGGPEQGAQQLVVFSNYDCCDPAPGSTEQQGHRNGTDRVFTAVFQQIDSILATDIGRTFTFQFDAKRGNIEGATTAQAFIRTLDPDADFIVTSNVELDVTDLPVDWGTYRVTLGPERPGPRRAHPAVWLPDELVERGTLRELLRQHQANL